MLNESFDESLLDELEDSINEQNTSKTDLQEISKQDRFLLENIDWEAEDFGYEDTNYEDSTSNSKLFNDSPNKTSFVDMSTYEDLDESNVMDVDMPTRMDGRVDNTGKN